MRTSSSSAKPPRRETPKPSSTWAYMYAKGEGVPQDLILAHAWLNLAAAQGDERAASIRDHLVGRMTPKQITQA